MDEPIWVSVIIPTYKRADLVCRAVDSVLAQTYPYVEAIVIDDNDPKWPERAQTETAMARYTGNEKVVYLRHERNKNGSAARNTGIRAAKGKYLCFLDDDDEFFPEKVAAVVTCMEARDRSWGACYCNYSKVSNGAIVTDRVKGYEGDLYIHALARNLYIIPGSNLTVRNDVAREVGGFDETFQRNQDIEFLTKVLQRYKLAYAPVLGTKCTLHYDPNRKTVDAITLKNNYLEKFGAQIERLSEKQKREVYRLIDLQTIRQLVMERNLKSAMRLVGPHASLWDVICYGFYLVRRKLTKSAYGFRVRTGS